MMNSKLHFTKATVAEAASKVIASIETARRKEAQEDWDEMHQPTLRQKMLFKFAGKPLPTIPPMPEDWATQRITNNFLCGVSYSLASICAAYCKRPDATDLIELTLDDADRLHLV